MDPVNSEDCTEHQKQDIQQLLESFEEIMQEPKELPPKRQVEHDVQLLPDAPIPNVGLYKQSIA